MHGVAAAYDCFTGMSTLLSGLKDKPMVVAMFDADNSSFYLDTPLPQKWSRVKTDTSTTKSLFTTFFFDEYIPALDKKYRVNPKERMLTGFSMGGYGAFHYMLAKPDMFCSVSSMSGAFMDLSQPLDDRTKTWMERLYGPMADHAAEYQAIDEFAEVKAAGAKGVKLPPIRLRIGTEDHLLKPNQQMRDLLKSLNYTCEYEESPGKHNWVFWKGAMTDILDFHWRMLPKN
jgi:S-formylglutathione hydrolase FrmB